MSKIADVLQSLREEEGRLRLELSRVERAIAALEGSGGSGGPGMGGGERETGDGGRGAGSAGTEAAPRTAAARTAVPKVTVRGPYSGMGILTAVVEYLRSAEEPKTTKEVAEALLAGGIETKSAKFVAAVRATLNRAAGIDGIAQDGDGQWRVKQRASQPSAPRT
jgi:hypothetical protein